ncbi:MAG: AP endonuclease [Treponema sp.]|jgi:sugar phosphate isomerase/epimerase|nr:AP endonuclease [Treponema sp.]
MMRLTVPSWVIPGTYLENLTFLKEQPAIKGVELLFFFYDRETQSLLHKEWKGILELQSRFNFTVHLPEPLLSLHEELVEQTLPVTEHYIFHAGPPEDAPALAGLIASWGNRFNRGKNPFVLENTLLRKFEALLEYLPDEVGICMDTGHLLLEGKEPGAFYRRFKERIQEIHLHGLDHEKARIDGRLPDHRPLRLNEPWFQEAIPLLAAFTGTVNLEVFSWEEVLESLGVLQAVGLL